MTICLTRPCSLSFYFNNNQHYYKICLYVNVSDFYSVNVIIQERPHFIDPSIPANSSLTCGAGETCHIMFQVTAGYNHTDEWYVIGKHD